MQANGCLRRRLGLFLFSGCSGRDPLRLLASLSANQRPTVAPGAGRIERPARQAGAAAPCRLQRMMPEMMHGCPRQATPFPYTSW